MIRTLRRDASVKDSGAQSWTFGLKVLHSIAPNYCKGEKTGYIKFHCYNIDVHCEFIRSGILSKSSHGETPLPRMRGCAL